MTLNFRNGILSIFAILTILQIPNCNCETVNPNQNTNQVAVKEGTSAPPFEMEGSSSSSSSASGPGPYISPAIIAVVKRSAVATALNSEGGGGGAVENSDEFYDYYYHDQEEPECPKEEFFHIRGRKCVPFDCPGGNQYRNKFNGECLLKRYGIIEDTRHRPQKMINRLIKQSKFRLPFGLTLKG